jgi:hypothetical protein
VRVKLGVRLGKAVILRHLLQTVTVQRSTPTTDEPTFRLSKLMCVKTSMYVVRDLQSTGLHVASKLP